MAKTCSYEGCNFPVWGGGYCNWHQTKRTDKKPKALKRGKPKSAEERKAQEEQIQKDHQFYQEIWETRVHKCFNCGQILLGEPLTIYFDHILEKAKYPSLRYILSNICLLCWDCHSNKSNGILSDKLRDLRRLTIKNLLLDGTEPTV